MNEKNSNILGTRCRKETFEKISKIYPNAEYEELSQILKIKKLIIVNLHKISGTPDFTLFCNIPYKNFIKESIVINLKVRLIYLIF